MPLQAQTTFLDVPYLQPAQAKTADLMIQGAPSDLATSGRPGTRFGPDAVRKASHGLLWEQPRWPWEFVLKEKLSIVDRGNIEFPIGHLHEMAAALEAATSESLRQGVRLFTLGGDHYVTLPLLRAHFKQNGRFALLQFDAHTDTDVYPHDHHGVMFHHAVNEGLLDADHSIQVGIRTFYDVENHPFAVLDADFVNSHSPEAVAAQIRARVGKRPIYLTFDIDCLDPAFAPGTGTPVIGGVTSNFALQVLRRLRGLSFIGMDLVEVSPPYDPSGATALAGATIALEMMHLMACA